VFVTAKPAITGGHPHRLRDTFAVSLLLKGVSLEIVTTLLGHSSIKVTGRHYSPWVNARQDQLETEVRRIWTVADAISGPPDVLKGAKVEPPLLLSLLRNLDSQINRAKTVRTRGVCPAVSSR
jgi:hypothetical protein